MSITVIEHWHLNDKASENAFSVMQEMDDLVEDNAHAAAGWDGHARFYQSGLDPHHVMMIYSWSSEEEARAMLDSESAQGLIVDFVERNCTRDRDVEFANELHIDV